MKRSVNKQLLCSLGFLLVVLSSVMAQTPATVGFLGLENLNRDPRYDYLEGMILGVMMYDFVRADDIELVERARLDRVLAEQNLRLSGLLSDEDTAKQVGQLAGADFLIDGNYAFLGTDVMINIKILDVDDGSSSTIMVRGATENSIHEAAGQAVEIILGVPIVFTVESGGRSLLSMEDQEPGSIEFYCRFEGGEVYANENFVGYTPGGEGSLLIEDLDPGTHRIRVDAGPGFGEIQWPEVIFKDWEREVEIRTGRELVLRAEIYSFNSLLYYARRIFDEEFRLEEGGRDHLSVQEDLSFTDRYGENQDIQLELNGGIDQGFGWMTGRLNVNGESIPLSLGPGIREETKTLKAGPLEVELELDYWNNRTWVFEVSIERTDIWQGLHQEM